MNITAKILEAHYFPNIILFKIFNRINLNFGETLVEENFLIVLRKIKSSFQLPLKFVKSKKTSLDTFWADGYCMKTNRY